MDCGLESIARFCSEYAHLSLIIGSEKRHKIKVKDAGFKNNLSMYMFAKDSFEVVPAFG